MGGKGSCGDDGMGGAMCEGVWMKRLMMRMCGSRGQYSDAVLSELEGQNDVQLEGMSAKVKMLKDVCPSHSFPLPPTLSTQNKPHI